MTFQERIDKSVELFHKGFNCAQAVTAAFADLYGLTEEQALKISASFGGGIGRMREVCGAASGMFILAGLQCGSAVEGDAEGKQYNYTVVQQLARTFIERNGSLFCAELLGLRPMQSHEGNPIMGQVQPEKRTEEYYKKRPCARMVEEGARIFAEYLQSLQAE